MRELKFRVWAKEHSRWLDPSYCSITGDSKVHSIEKPFCLLSGDAMVDKVVVEQFTGLLDKSGEEIYEGDVVRQLVTSTPKDQFEDYYVEYMFASMKLCWLHECKAKFLEWPAEQCLEIIGNIHQNPELIK
jgi:uncharacterized phage protein (TIGR01671 family)